MNKYIPSIAGRFGFLQYFVSSSAIPVLTYHRENRRNKRKKHIAKITAKQKEKKHRNIAHNPSFNPNNKPNSTREQDAP
jgi:hypothetical protein